MGEDNNETKSGFYSGINWEKYRVLWKLSDHRSIEGVEIIVETSDSSFQKYPFLFNSKVHICTDLFALIDPTIYTFCGEYPEGGAEKKIRPLTPKEFSAISLLVKIVNKLYIPKQYHHDKFIETLYDNLLKFIDTHNKVFAESDKMYEEVLVHNHLEKLLYHESNNNVSQGLEQFPDIYKGFAELKEKTEVFIKTVDKEVSRILNEQNQIKTKAPKRPGSIIFLILPIIAQELSKTDNRLGNDNEWQTVFKEFLAGYPSGNPFWPEISKDDLVIIHPTIDKENMNEYEITAKIKESKDAIDNIIKTRKKILSNESKKLEKQLHANTPRLSRLIAILSEHSNDFPKLQKLLP